MYLDLNDQLLGQAHLVDAAVKYISSTGKLLFWQS